MNLLLLAVAFALAVAVVASVIGRRARPLRAVLADGTLSGERRRFRTPFADAAIAGSVLDAVHGALMPRLQPPCTAMPEARLCADLGLTPADIEDVALLAAAELGGHIPNAAELDAFRAEEATVAQLVRFVADCAAAGRATAVGARVQVAPAA